MKQFITAAFVLLSFWVGAQTINPNDPARYEGKTFNATSASTDAVAINRYDTVYFVNCVFNGLLRGYGGSNIKAINCTFNGIKPVGSGEQWNRGIDVYQPQALYVEGCTFNHTGGIRVDHRNENTRSIVVRNSKFYNIDSRDGNNYYNKNNFSQKRAAFIMDGVGGVEGEFAYNYIYNALDSSCVEDNVNLRNSGGKPGKPFRIHHIFIDGAYSCNFDYISEIPSTSGTTLETAGTKKYVIDSIPTVPWQDNVAMTCYVQIDSCRIVRCMNSGINMTSTHDTYSFGNTIISSGKLPDGRPSYGFWGTMGIWDGSGLGAALLQRVSQKGNTIACVRPGFNVGGKDRQDYVVVPGSPIAIAPTDNYSLSYTPTKATEDSQYGFWLQDIGQKTTVASPTTGYKLTFNVSGVTLSIDTATGIIAGQVSIQDETGTKTIYQPNSFTYSTSNAAVASVAPYTTDETRFYITPKAAGTSTVTVNAKSHLGNAVSTSFVVNVAQLYKEAKKLVVSIEGAK